MSNKSITEKTQLVNVNSPKAVATFAKELKEFVIANKLYTTIGTGKDAKNFVQVEGWQFAGASMGYYFAPTFVEDVSPKDGETVTYVNKKGIKVTNPVYKYKSTVEMVRVSDGVVVGRGFALCSNQEQKKKTFDEYAVLSMAQTRGIGKAGRNTLGWVMKLAGYEPTPSEEIDETFYDSNEDAKESVVTEPSTEEVKALVTEKLALLPIHEKMRTLKTVGKLNDKDLSDKQYRQLWYELGLSELE